MRARINTSLTRQKKPSEPRVSRVQGALEKHAPVVYVLCRELEDASIIATQRETIGALAKSTKAPPPAALHMVAEGCSPPRGCATEILSRSLEVHILLKGVVDFSKEITRLQKEMAQIKGRLEKLKAKMAKPDYATRCPAATQEDERAKAQAAEGELAALAAAIEQFSAE